MAVQGLNIRALTCIPAALGAAALLSACGIASESSVGKATGAAEARETWNRPVPKAACGPTDKVETGLQGQVPLQDRQSGRSRQGYNCNLELVGQWQGQGAGWQHAWFEDCAYFGQSNKSGQTHPGVTVIDARDVRAPHPTAYLAEQPMLDPWESLKVNEQRKLLGAVDGAGGSGGPGFAVYDLASDCRAPTLLFSGDIGADGGHAGNFVPDGMTYYASPSGSPIRAIDVSNPANPALITNVFPDPTHDLSISDDGKRAYFAMAGVGSATKNGLAIIDTTEVQERKADPKATLISELTWGDGVFSQMTEPITIGGHPYLLFTDELSTRSCAPGDATYGVARIIDLADETHPTLVARLMLETHDPANCELTLPDTAGQAGFAYDSHYCTADDPHNTTAVACGHFNSGIRVFDVRDPYLPREIAYFNPPAQLLKQEQLPASNNSGEKTADYCSANVRFKRTQEGGELWTTCQDNGFMILKFTNSVWPFKAGA